MSKPQPHAVTIFPWLRANLGRRALAPLTGTDTKALRAAVEIMELYSYDRHPSLLEAFRAVVMRMQPGTRYLAYHGIAHVMDWSNRSPIWEDAELGDIPARLCSFEPGGSYKDLSKE